MVDRHRFFEAEEMALEAGRKMLEGVPVPDKLPKLK